MSMFENIKCPLCEYEKFKIVKKSKINFNKELNLNEVFKSSTRFKLLEQIVKCEKCDLVYLNPRIKEDKIIKSYKDSIDNEHASQDKYRIITFKKFLKKHKFFFSKNYNTQILDVGTASGAFLVALKDIECTAVGIEPNKQIVKRGIENHDVNIINSHLTNNLFPDNKFDMIYFWDVFEHLAFPNKALQISYKMAKKNGLVFINFPNYKSFISILLGKYWPFWLSAHLCYYDKKTIKHILHKNNFEVLHFYPHWQTLSLTYVLDRASEYFKIFKYINKIIKIMRIDKLPLNYYIGQTLVVAKKK